MQTTVQYLNQIDQSKPVKYVLPSNLNDRYRQIDPQLQQVLKLTQKCPFSNIRQLIIAFKRTDNYSTDIRYSDILNEKYSTNPKLKQTDDELNICISQVQQSQLRFHKLQQCINKYNTLYGFLSRQQSNLGMQQHSKQSKAQHNQRIFTKNNEIALQKQNRYFQYVTYSQELEKALVLASISQAHKFKPSSIGQSVIVSNQIDNFRILSDFSNKMTKQFLDTQQKLNSCLFEWRQKVKRDAITYSDNIETNNRIAEWRAKSSEMDEIYSQMSNFTNWLQRDRDELRRIYEGNSRSYQSFLPDYIKVKETYEIQNKKPFFYETIKDEKKKLEAHLRKNYGMIVPYSVSQQFQKTISPLQMPRNRQLKNLVYQQLQPLQDGLTYINYEYEKLYRDACDDKDGRSGVRRKVQENLNKFTKYSQNPSQDNLFALHLIQSCRKLLRIAK